MEKDTIEGGRLKSLNWLRKYARETPVEKRPEHLKDAENWLAEYDSQVTERDKR